MEPSHATNFPLMADALSYCVETHAAGAPGSRVSRLQQFQNNGQPYSSSSHTGAHCVSLVQKIQSLLEGQEGFKNKCREPLMPDEGSK